MITFIDTSALISLLHPDNKFNEKTSDILYKAYKEGSLIINEIVYSELSADPYFGKKEELEKFLKDTNIKLKNPKRETLFLAGKKFRSYIDKRGKKLQCPSCGEKNQFKCPNCKETISARQHLPSDFLIGAHAQTESDQLITFDKGFFETYFEIETIGIKNE